MLPSSLLITRRWHERITPLYAQLTPENLGIAELLIQTYKDHIGRKKKELAEALEGLEETGYDYRYVRGLAILLDRRSQLEFKSTMDPVQARKEVFKSAHERGLPTTIEERDDILQDSAARLGVAMEELEESLYGDLEGELVLRGLQVPEPEALVKQYNLSLSQTLLFYSTELSFTTQGNWQQMFRRIKWLGLIYTVQRNDGEYEVKVDGPLSLFKLNRRYGTRLAKLLPAIIRSGRWSVRAKILHRKGGRELLNLELDSEKHGGYMEAYDMPEESYDSSVEQSFAEHFRALSTGWTLTREPEPIPVAGQVMIPDFSLEKGGMKVYLEVVGFWTPEYLREKVKKLSSLADVDMIVAADRSLACKKLDKIGERLNVIYYRGRIPLRPVLTHLENREQQLVKEQTKRLSLSEIRVQKDVVELRELAKDLGVEETALNEIVKERAFPGYMNLGGMLIKDIKMREIHQRIEEQLEQGEVSLDEASKIIEEAGGKRPTSILDALGYRIEWQGIDPQSTKIRRGEISKSEDDCSG